MSATEAPAAPKVLYPLCGGRFLADLNINDRRSAVFKVYKVVGSAFGVPLLATDKVGLGVTRPAEAAMYLFGYVGPAGNSQWQFGGPVDGAQVRCCGRRDLEHIGRLLTELYDLAAATIPGFEEEVPT